MTTSPSWKTRLILLILVASCRYASCQEPPLEGNALCPCLTDSGLQPVLNSDLTEKVLQQLDGTNISTYGLGCQRHDSMTAQCVQDDDCPSVIPTPPDCSSDRSWCDRSWCFVDPLNCNLLNRRSGIFPRSGRYYSYATCYDMDSFSQKRLLASLAGRTLRVGFNSNSGGWTGAYSSTGQHFVGPQDVWSGPAVNFVNEGALVGGFQIKLEPPPDFLYNKSLQVFSSSMFDYCVYATALGYLHMCVADYTVTEQRAASTDWLLLGTEPLYLIVQTDTEGGSAFDQAINNVALIFQPFTLGSWMFIIFAVVPILAILMVFHEYRKPGSIFLKKENVVVKEEDGSYEIEEREIPLYRHILKSIYIMMLSPLHQSYEASVVTYGAKINLLGVAFFILTIIAVYTANLAAILTQQGLVTPVDSFEDAISLGFRICGERKNIQDLSFIYGVSNDLFAVDPPEEGGDGQAGFNCANCKSRSRVFDFLDFNKAATDSKYCHAAIAPLQDLTVLQTDGSHCNKTHVGQPVRFVQSGFPVHEGVSREVIALFLKLKNDGIYDKELIASQPSSRCPSNPGGEGSALSIAQLMGIWVVTFGFAIVGVLVTCLQPWWRRKTSKKEMHKVMRRNQWSDSVRNQDNVPLMLERSSSESVGNHLVVGHNNIKQRRSSTQAAHPTSSTIGSSSSSSLSKRHLKQESSMERSSLTRISSNSGQEEEDDEEHIA